MLHYAMGGAGVAVGAMMTPMLRWFATMVAHVVVVMMNLGAMSGISAMVGTCRHGEGQRQGGYQCGEE